MNVWNKNPELASHAKALWDKGMSAGQIAAELGNGITRNAVIGKLTRMKGHVQRLVPSRRAFILPLHSGTPSKNKTKAEPFIPPVSTLEPFRLDGKLVTPETMTAHGMCKYPHGEPSEPGFHYCGHPQKDNSPYCDFHHGRCFVAATGKSNLDRTMTRNSGILRALG